MEWMVQPDLILLPDKGKSPALTPAVTKVNIHLIHSNVCINAHCLIWTYFFSNSRELWSRFTNM